MPQILLTPASLSALNQLLLSVTITAYLIWRLIRRRRQSVMTQADRLLTVFFASFNLFSLGLFLEVSLLPTERLIVVYTLNTLLALALLSLLQFAYHFPQSDRERAIERRVALAVSAAYFLCEAGIAVWRFSLLSKAQVVFRPPELDYAPAFFFAWIVFAFARGAAQTWRNAASRRFALIFVIPVILVLLNILRSYALVSNPLYHISVSIGILATLFLFTLNYLASQPEATPLIVKFSGAVLAEVLAVFGAVGWIVTPAYAAQYRPALIDERSIRFTPNSAGGYDVTEIPFRFEQEWGQRAALTDEPGDIGSYHETRFDFPFFGQRYSRLFIHSDGMIGFGRRPQARDLEYRLSDTPIFFALGLDLAPEASAPGGIHLREEAGRLIVTYHRIRAYHYPEREYTFQVALYVDGRIDLTFNGLPDDPPYQANDRPDASIRVIGAKRGLATGESVSLAQLPISGRAGDALDDQYLAFRRQLHEFLSPLAGTVLAGSALFLLGFPVLMVVSIARPLKALLAGVEQFNQDQQYRQIAVQSNDEIGFLTQSFNTLTWTVNDLIDTLEKRVAERTDDLLRANAELLKLSIAVEQSPSAIIITNPAGDIEYVNPAFTLSTGYTSEEVKGRNPRFLKSGRTPSDVFRDMWDTLLKGQVWRGEIVNRRKNGEDYWEYTVIAPIHDVDGRIIHYVAVKEDITARKVAEAKLEELAVTDPLTGLLNRRGFFARADATYTRCKQSGCALAVLMMDIDHFKAVNDRYGHVAGDAVLREIATRIRASLRPTDLVARYGGEEFVALLASVSPDEDVTRIAERLNLAAGARPVEYNGHGIRATLSIGVATLTPEIDSLDELLSRADKAMYRAKQAGRNCCVGWSQSQ